MKDPIKVIQVTLDKIFIHLPHFKEFEFYIRFGFGSLSINSIDKALAHDCKASHTSEWGLSLEIKGD